MKPDNFEDISAVLALYRPGPMGANSHTNYALRKNGLQEITPIHPELEEPLAEILDTHLRPDRLPGAGHGDRAEGRRLLARPGRHPAPRDGQEEEVRAGQAVRRLLGRHEGQRLLDAAVKTLWDILLPFSDYAFNKAHSAAYGVLCYWTAYLKAHYPAEYMAALLTSVGDAQGQARPLPQRVPPHGHHGAAARRQRVDRLLHRRRQRHPLRPRRRPQRRLQRRRRHRGGARGEGPLRVVPRLPARRSPIRSQQAHHRVADQGRRVRLARRTRGARSSRSTRTPSSRPSRIKRNEAIGTVGFDFDSLFEDDEREAAPSLVPDRPEWAKQDKLAFEREMLGLYVSDHPLAGLEVPLAKHASTTITELMASDATQDGDTVTIAGLVTSVQHRVARQSGNQYGMIQVEDFSRRDHGDVHGQGVPGVRARPAGRLDRGRPRPGEHARRRHEPARVQRVHARARPGRRVGHRWSSRCPTSGRRPTRSRALGDVLIRHARRHRGAAAARARAHRARVRAAVPGAGHRRPLRRAEEPARARTASCDAARSRRGRLGRLVGSCCERSTSARTRPTAERAARARPACRDRRLGRARAPPARSSTTCASTARRRCSTRPSASTACAPRRVRVPADELDEALDAPRARRSRGALERRSRACVPASAAQVPAPETHRARRRRRRRAALAARRPRRPLRAGRQGRLPVERRHERRAGPGRRRALDRARVAAAGRVRRARSTPRSPPPRRCSASTEVYAMGGAGAIGAFAYGVPGLGLEPVQRVTGPGNVYVAAAKRLVQGVTGIDAEAGSDRHPRDRRRRGRRRLRRGRPREPGRARRARGSRARHRLAPSSPPACVERLADARRGDEAHRAGPQRRRRAGSRPSCSSTTSSRPPTSANAFGPEHLEIQVRDADAVLARIENAGAIFIGPYSPGEPRRLRGGLEPRAADRRPGPVRGRASRRCDVPAPAAGRALRRGGAARGRAGDRRALGRGGPARARRGRHGALRTLAPEAPCHGVRRRSGTRRRRR